MNRSRLLLVAVALPLALGACKKKKPEVAPPPVQGGNPDAGPVRPPENRGPTTPPSTGPSDVDRVRMARESMANKIYFEYDADALSDEARANLDQKVRVMQANPNLRVRIAGHCDERGSDEYNIALGRRRAVVAKQYLVDRGIDASRIETTSFGRERPEQQGSSEDAWAKNRRDEFEITAGGDTMRAP